jgi:hypothetical protein
MDSSTTRVRRGLARRLGACAIVTLLVACGGGDYVSDPATPQPIARVLHGRVATHLAGNGASAARLAHHLLSAGDDTAAVPHLARAARQAWHLGRSRETREAYFRAAAIELANGKPDAAFDLLFDCAESMTELGHSTKPSSG